MMLLSVAALAGAAVAFPAGLYWGQPLPAADPARPRIGSASVRNRYAPAILSDPYFVDRQRRLVEALEAGCRTSGAHCAEARAARRRLLALEDGR